jgi:hypothetical protein
LFIFSPKAWMAAEAACQVGHDQRVKRPNGCAFVTNCRRCECASNRENVSIIRGSAAQSGLAYARHHVNDGRKVSLAGRWNESRIAGIVHAGDGEPRCYSLSMIFSENRTTLFRIVL